ncbi:MAG: MobA/MobL family protein [Clostridia bacterium]|nr:MobA/MobL family protein [Clostridia bacterium]
MAIYHCSVKIGGRSSGKSAVASAAYRSGRKFEDKEQGLIFDYTKKSGIVGSEILLCENAPTEYQDRATLWNAVQEVEKSKDAQLYREVELALPQEWTWEQRKQYTREYVQEQFVSKGMCADICYHDKKGNPHAHIMLTTRQIKENGEWDVKERKAYMTDEDGNKVPKIDKKKLKAWEQENGRKFDYKVENDEELKKVQKMGARNRREWERVTQKVNDWNEHYKVEEWREAWAKKCNEHLGQGQQLDHRSYERQGKDQIPTIHEGTTARKIEKNGGISERVQFNREVKQLNMEIANTENDLYRAITEKARDIYGEYVGILSEQAQRVGERFTNDKGLTGEAAEIRRTELRASTGEREAEKSGIGTENADTKRNRTDDVFDTYESIAGVREEQQGIEKDLESLRGRFGEFCATARNVGERIGQGQPEQQDIDGQQASIKEATSRFEQLRATFTELRSRVVQLREKIQSKLDEAFRKAQESEKASEGIKVSPAEQKADTGQNMSVMERFRQEQERTEKERAEKARAELKPLQPGKTYGIYKDEENGIYIKARVQEAGVYGYNTVHFSLTVNGQTQELDSQLVTKDKTIKDAYSYSKPTQEKVKEYRASAQKKLEEAQEYNQAHREEPKPEERPSILKKLNEAKAEVKARDEAQALEQEHTVQHRPRMRR